MSESAPNPIEIIFSRAPEGRIRIDACQAGRRVRDQGRAYHGTPVIVAMTTQPAGGDGRTALAADGFMFAHANNPGCDVYRRVTASGVYTLFLEAGELRLEYATVKDGCATEHETLLRLTRTPGKTLWPEGCASEGQHIAIALSVARYHAGNGPSR